jgi:squalene-hopene/tetraprenyl-beta-curcumene cyclase
VTAARIAEPALRATTDLAAALDSTRAALLGRQQADGHWVGELQGDTILESEYVLLLAFLGEESSETARKAARYILRQQQADGGWSNYPDGPFELSVSVKAYFALKLTGHDPDEPYMVQARQRIREAGGAAKCNSFTRLCRSASSPPPDRCGGCRQNWV